ncbi:MULTISPECIES: PLP-dependent aminotransferase family protein [unclassified Duganella]|uniref:aminotransferase-like domain-containing protein n=1 Tax=unclassified Duganella TaxID=2636909 RepID=UPI000E354707|nr:MULTISPECIES: PLP-dependent aminotransferase family protein [unclassified Duganella]RFP13687.1 PLP-dependent aminotransferase family protein [Duganella sp. BJB475]RFP36395.1 PLP-dependent aminotransferase family protein [Duganella sp. BJB476]
MFAIDRSSPIALSSQIEAKLRQMVESRALPGGAKLMSIRQLATQLAVSTNTIVTAYDRLVAAGIIDSHGTAGFFVSTTNGASKSIPDEVALEAGEEQEPVWLAQQANDQRAGILLASSGALPPTWLQDAVPATVVQKALARSAAGMASRCPPQGLPELREHIALLLRGIGIAADAGHILTTLGGTHTIDLICRSFLQPGDTVLVEDPGYFLMFGRLRQDGIRLVPIKRRPEGLDLDELEAACREHRPRLLFVQTALHNPTGWSSSAANLHKVLMLAQQHGFLIAEDDVHGHFQQGHSTRLAAMAGLDGVIYYSSFCKVLSPALRMGYLAAAPALLKVLMRTKIHSIMTMPALNEYVLLEVLRAGNLRKHLDRMQRKIMAARNASTQQLSAAGVLFEQPGDAGIFLWGTMPEGLDVDLLVQDAYRNNILLMRGAAFSANDTPDQHIRFNVAFSQHPRLSSYLQERLQAVAGARSSLARASNAANLKD